MIPFIDRKVNSENISIDNYRIKVLLFFSTFCLPRTPCRSLYCTNVSFPVLSISSSLFPQKCRLFTRELYEWWKGLRLQQLMLHLWPQLPRTIRYYASQRHKLKVMSLELWQSQSLWELWSEYSCKWGYRSA